MLALSTHRGVLLKNVIAVWDQVRARILSGNMEQLIRDLCGVAVYIDNILVKGNNAQEYLETIRTQFRSLNEKGLCCNVEKCIFA